MDKIYFSDLEHVEMNDMLGSESILCNCDFNGNFYLYKQPVSFNKEVAKKMEAFTHFSNPYLVMPKFIIYGDNSEKPIGYLLEYLDNYKSLYYLDLNKINKIKILKKVKEAIIEMHKTGIIHCDLHLANILYNDNDIRIIDFDSAKYLNYSPFNYNNYTKNYLENNELDISTDIYNFNIDTFACLNNISWDNVFEFDFTRKLDYEKQKVWQKTKERKELTYDDFLIDRFC